MTRNPNRISVGPYGQCLKFCTISQYLDTKKCYILIWSLGYEYDVTINFLLIIIFIKTVEYVLHFKRGLL